MKSGIWVALTTVFERGLQLTSVLVLAGLLSPTAIGLVGSALLVVSVLDPVSGFGIGRALVQREEHRVIWEQNPDRKY